MPGNTMVIILDKHVFWCYNFIAGYKPILVFIIVWNEA